MFKKLNEISTVIAGYAFRGAIEAHSNGDAYVVQAKNIAVGDPIGDTSALTKTLLGVADYSTYLKKNDILIVARGMKSGAFRATVFASDAPNVVASSSVHIIRIKDESILPEYVAYYLNSTDGQAALSAVISGSYIGALLRKDLETITIPLPSPQTQGTVVRLHKNIEDQQSLLDRKKQINLTITNSVFKNLITG